MRLLFSCCLFGCRGTKSFIEEFFFFTINPGVPKVLITSQNQGNPNNYLYFKETENKELKDSFSNIVNSSVTLDDVKSNFTKDEQLSYFISNYGQLRLSND
nr:DUF4767 domain-containing protein [Enterococcus hirae]